MHRRFLLLAGGAAVIIGARSVCDPFRLRNEHSPYYAPVRDGRMREMRSSRLNPAERTAVFITAGQSLIGNWSGAAYSVANAAKVDNLNLFDGGLYAPADPALGNDGAEAYWPYRMADMLINAGDADRVILVPCAMGSTRIADWAPGGDYDDRITVATRRCHAAGLPVTAILWQQGEGDAADGTSKASWMSAFNSMVAKQHAEGNSAPWLVGRSTYTGVATSPQIRAAQTEVVDGINVFAGGDTDTIDSSFRQTGIPHFLASGAHLAAALWRSAILASPVLS